MMWSERARASAAAGWPVSLVLAVFVQAAVLGFTVWLPTNFHIAFIPEPPDPTERVSRLTFIPLAPPRAWPSRPETSVSRHGPDGRVPVVAAGEAPNAVAADARERIPESRNPPATPGAGAANWLASPFLPDPDPRLHVPPSTEREQQLRGVLNLLRDSILHAPPPGHAVDDWSFSLGEGARLGVSPGIVLHLGRIAIPLPARAVHLRDLDPRERARRSMLNEVNAQAERMWRDSILSARRRP